MNDDTVKRLAADCGTAPAVEQAKPPTPGQPPLQPRVEPTAGTKPVVAEDFTFELTSCKLSGTTLDCQMRITNNGEDGQLVIDPYQTRVIDSAGGEHRVKNVNVANTGSYEAQTVSQVPIAARITFHDVPSDSERIPLLEIIGRAHTYRDFKVQFRSVSIIK